MGKSEKNKNIYLIKKAGKNPAFYNYFTKILHYSTVTDFARFLGWSILQPLITAI